MIDPTCGSGHFLLGGFARLFRLWMNREDNEVVAAQKALDGVWGVDINPFAVAIARFRLIVAALVACGIKRLKYAPSWKIHLATGDSLLFGSRWNRTGEKVWEQTWFATDEGSWAPEIYACEDKDGLQEVLCQQYHAVVGNPPYITVKDSGLNEAYRHRYPRVCHRQYSVAVPFTERFFDLALASENGRCGYVGMITANSFMKREFGKKLIEDFFPRIDLSHVVDTSGAYIPGHGTPTVILFGRNRTPNGDAVRAVLGIKGEPGTPDDASHGLVWQSIVRQIDRAGAQDEFTSTADVTRTTFVNHPWSIGGGGAADLKDRIESAGTDLDGYIEPPIGRAVRIAEEEVFMFDSVRKRHSTARDDEFRGFLLGETIRDWRSSHEWWVWYPYCEASEESRMLQSLWQWKTTLENRRTFQGVMADAGLKWFDYMQHTASAYCTPLSIAFAFVATHNHFVLDRGGKVFKQSAPIIKLPAAATEDDHLALLGLLNSSTACFWMKQVMNCKGLGGQGGGIKPEHWSRQYEYASTQMERFPIPEGYRSVIPLVKEIDRLAQATVALLPDAVVRKGTQDLEHRLLTGRQAFEKARRRMVAIQEELDWKVYSLYGLCSDTIRGVQDESELHPENRPVERLLKQRLSAGEKSIFYEVHAYRGTGTWNGPPVEEIERLIDRRLALIEKNPDVRMIKQLDFKRRWQTEPWQDQQQRALRNWILDRIENPRYWPDLRRHEPKLQSVAQLADKASGDHDFLQVAALYRGRTDFDVAALVNELIESESVPFLPVLRYKPSGLRKREVWERTWDLQRKQDAGEDVGNIPVPPKYATADFLKNDYWRLRGKLDVPKERWISYPHLQTESDSSMVVGWAGWNHLQQATALVSYYDARKREGWDAKRLTPILAGLDQIVPWIHQWHPEIDPEFGDTAGQSYQSLLENDAHELGLTLDDIRNWEPPVKGGKRKAKG